MFRYLQASNVHVIGEGRKNVLKTPSSRRDAAARGFLLNLECAREGRVHGLIQGRRELLEREGQSWTGIFHGYNPHLRVSCEALLADSAEQMLAMLGCLQAEVVPSSSPWKRPSTDDLAAFVEKVEALHDDLSGTSFATCFS